MKIASIPVFDGPVGEAYAAAMESGAPLFVPTPVYTDDRGWSLMNLFQQVLAEEGQINYSVTYPQVIKAWHRHKNQTDFWLCLHGHLKIGIFDQVSNSAWQTVSGEKNPGIVVIAPKLWHGLATVGPEPAGLLYYVTQMYDPEAPDEERRDYDSVEGFTWEIQHR